ncbi:hypothetical protein P7C71_g6310, partial [Lecanoromycetidae sp. Uapishka_2]
MPHATATFNGKIIAETDKWEFVEGNVYFPPSAVDQMVLSKTSTTSYCPWKGNASYYSISVDGKSLMLPFRSSTDLNLGQEAKDAAWYYPTPKTGKAEPLKDHVAFYKSKVDIKSD